MKSPAFVGVLFLSLTLAACSSPSIPPPMVTTVQAAQPALTAAEGVQFTCADAPKAGRRTAGLRWAALVYAQAGGGVQRLRGPGHPARGGGDPQARRPDACAGARCGWGGRGCAGGRRPKVDIGANPYRFAGGSVTPPYREPAMRRATLLTLLLLPAVALGGHAYAQEFRCLVGTGGLKQGEWRIEGKNGNAGDLVCWVSCMIPPGPRSSECHDVTLRGHTMNWAYVCGGKRYSNGTGPTIDGYTCKPK
jgi:hypothetical protein